MSDQVMIIEEYQSEDNAESCLQLACHYAICASEHTALCDVQYLQSELEHYTTGDYAGSACRTESELLTIASSALERGITYLLITCKE